MGNLKSITQWGSLALVLVLLPLTGHAANICDPTTGSQCAKVDLNGNLATNAGKSTVATYNASSSALVTTALFNLSLEAEAARGFRVSRVCVGVTNATAAAGVTVTVNRRSTASSGGTVSTQEGTGADSVSKFDPADGNWTGIVRRTGTLGTIGPTLDQWSFQVGELGAGAADVPGLDAYCRDYGLFESKMPTVLAGTSNGLSVNVSAPGAGGLAFGSISVQFAAN